MVALVALVFAASAQVWLETARGTGTTPWLAFGVFGVGALLAVMATWRTHDGAAHLCIQEVPDWRWFLACLPGLGLLGAAAWVRWFHRYDMPHGVLVLLWSSGIVALLAVGVAHRLSHPPQSYSGVGGRWSTRKLLLAYAALAVVALAMRTIYGFDNLPANVEADEAYFAIAARNLREDDPFNWFSVMMVAMPTIQMLPFMVTQELFGDDLWGTRAGGVLMGTLTVLFTFALARRLAGNVVGFTAALLVAGAHTLVHFSRTAQVYTATPLHAAVTMWLFARAWTGGSLLSWLGAGVALGIGTQTYQASQAMPVVIALTTVGWWLGARIPWRRVAALTITVEGIALVLLLPVGFEMIRQVDLTAARPKAIYSFSQQNRDAMGEDAWPTLTTHVGRCLAIFNTGTDNVANYAAARSLVDPVTAALVPLAAALVLVGLRSSVGWVCAAWVGSYLVLGVMLIMPPPTFHRLPAAVVFACFGVAWALARLATVIRDGFGLGKRFVAVACVGIAAAAVAANAEFYLHEYRLARPMVHTMGFTRVACRYAATHTVVDATTLDGHELVPSFNTYLSYECPEMKHVRIQKAAELWDIAGVTSDERVAFIVPEKAVTANPGTPSGYRVVKKYVDETILFPAPLPLAVYELEREVDENSFESEAR